MGQPAGKAMAKQVDHPVAGERWQALTKESGGGAAPGTLNLQ